MQKSMFLTAGSVLALIIATAGGPAFATDPDAALAAMKTQVFSTGPERREGVPRFRHRTHGR